MALTKTERRALEILRNKVALERAALTPPPRAAERGYQAWGEMEPTHRPLAANPYPATSNEWTNDVAASLKVYTESWVLPIIDALLDESGPGGKRGWEARSYLDQVA